MAGSSPVAPSLKGLGVISSVGVFFCCPILPTPIYPGCDWDMKRGKELSGRRGISTGQDPGEQRLSLKFPPGFALHTETECFIPSIQEVSVCCVCVSVLHGCCPCLWVRGLTEKLFLLQAPVLIAQI